MGGVGILVFTAAISVGTFVGKMGFDTSMCGCVGGSVDLGAVGSFNVSLSEKITGVGV